MSLFKRKPKPWIMPDDIDYPAGQCRVRMRPPYSISGYWPCNLPDGHVGYHVWSIYDPVKDHTFNGTYTTEEAIRSWKGPAG